jgi:transcriptional regulator with XRE-family HTH domain
MARKSNQHTIPARELRQRRGLTQEQFWKPLGVTQSAGSRYESGRGIPAPVRELLRLAHVEGIDLRSLRGEDWSVVSYLKEHEPELFAALRRKSTGSRQQTAA